MTLVPTRDSSALVRDLVSPELQRPLRACLYPYLLDDAQVWLPSDYLNPLDDVVARRVRHQLIRSGAAEWTWPLRWQNYYSGERVYVDERGFQVHIDVRPFKPHEITVKTTDDYIAVSGEHARRNDGRGMVERRLYRKYMLPRGFKASEAISNISTDGVLTIKVPPPPPPKYYSPEERCLLIRETGRRALPWI